MLIKFYSILRILNTDVNNKKIQKQLKFYSKIK